MPAKTERQRRAMAAAAAGRSTLGIPQEVGREFMGGGSKKNASQGMKGMAYREKHDPKRKGNQMKGYGDGSNPGYKHRAKKPKYSTGGTMSGAVGNPEYRHDELKKSRNPQTRGTKKTGYETGHGSRNTQTPSNYYVQDGAVKMQRCMAYKMRRNRGRGSVSSKAFKGGGDNPYGGSY